MLNHTSLKQGSLMIKCGKLDSWIVTVNVGRTTLFFFFFGGTCSCTRTEDFNLKAGLSVLMGNRAGTRPGTGVGHNNISNRLCMVPHLVTAQGAYKESKT